MPIISYGLDSRKLTQGAKKVKSSLGGISSKALSVGKTLGGIFSPLKVAIAGLAGGFGASALVSIGDQYTNMAGQLEYLSGSAEDAAQAQELLFQMSQQTGTSMLQNSKALTRFALASEMTGLNMEQNVKVLGAINTKMIQTGVSSQEASSAMIQLGQALASGKLQGDEFRSMAENAPALMNELAKSLGVSRSALKEMGSAGEITSEVLGKAFLDMAESADSTGQELPMTVSRMWTKVVNATQKMWDTINDETGILSWVAQGIDNLASWVEENIPRIVAFFISIKEEAILAWPDIKAYFVNVMSLATELGNLFIEVWPIVKQVIVGMAKIAAWLLPKIEGLVKWVTTLIEKLKTLAKYLPFVGDGEDALNAAQNNQLSAASDNFNEPGESATPSNSSAAPQNNTTNIFLRQNSSRSDVANIAQNLNNYKANL